MKIKYFKTICMIFVLLIVIFSGCSAKYTNTPIGVVHKLFDSLQENDANKYLDSITPTDRQQPGYFFYKQLIQGVAGLVGLDNMDATKLKIGFSNLKITEINNDGKQAVVAVNGKLRDLNFAIEQDFSTTLVVDKINNDWFVNLSSNNNDLIGINGSLKETSPEETTQQLENVGDVACGGWKLHLVEVEKIDEGGWSYQTGNLAIESNTIQIGQATSRVIYEILSNAIMTTNEGYTYSGEYWSLVGSKWIPPFFRYKTTTYGTTAYDGSNYDIKLSYKVAKNTTGHIVKTECGTFDYDNPEVNLKFPTDFPSEEFLSIGSPIQLQEGTLSIDFVSTTENKISFTFINPSQGYGVDSNYDMKVIGDDGFLNSIIKSDYNNYYGTIYADPGETIKYNVEFATSSVINRKLIICNDFTFWIVNLDN